MKYEMIFGDEKLFDGAPEDAEAVFKNQMREIRCAYYRLSHGHERYTSGEWVKVPSIDSQTFSAMRRIIAEPKRWTVEDKKAGRLPEVGAECSHCHSVDKRTVLLLTDKHVGIECDNSDVNPYFVTHAEFIKYYIPIETPAEKAQREEDEFIDSLKSVEIHDGTVSVFFNQGARAAYRKLKGGE